MLTYPLAGERCVMLTEAEKATNYDTFRHIERVRNLLNVCVFDLLSRGKIDIKGNLIEVTND